MTPPTEPENMEEIQAGVDLYLEGLRPDEVIELRAFQNDKPKWQAYSNDREFLAREVARINATGANVYLTVNPCPGWLSARLGVSNETYAAKTGAGAGNKDINRRKWLVVDLDPARQAKTASTDAEKKAAFAVARDVRTWAKEQGWPSPVLADSGNGYHLIWRIDLPGDKTGDDLVSNVLEHINDLFEQDSVKVDTVVGNKARILRAYGTKNTKGKPTADRPHRLSRIMINPSHGLMVTREQLQEVARLADTKDQQIEQEATRTRFDLEEFIRRNLPGAVGPEAYGGGQKWVIPVCPWRPEHDNSSAWIIRLPSGGLSAGCHHNGCKGKDWHELRRLFEPDFDQQKWTSTTWEDGDVQAGPADTGDEPVDHTAYLNEQEWTDLGNAKSLIAIYGHRLRWCAESGKWFSWTGTHWGEDRKNKALAWANKTILARAEAAGKLDEDKQDKAFKFFKSCQATAKRNSLLEQVKAWGPNLITLDELDQDGWALNCKNGTLDLRTSNLRPHRQLDYITKRLDVDYNPKAKCPKWETYLDRAMEGDREMVSFLRRSVGYSLTGSTREHAIFVLFGNGGTGKSVFMSVLGKLLAGYSCAAQASTFGESKNENIRNDVARLKGARLAHCSETKDGFRFDEGLLKQMTGQDKLSARFLHCEHFEFYPCFKIWIATNYAPQIRGTDDGIWRRIRLIPWPVKVPPEEIDKDLVDKLATELPGILAWAVRGCEEWIALGGLREPEKIEQSTQEYRSEMDLFGSFLETCCNLGQYETPSTEFYTRYRQWLATQGEYEITHTKMGLILKSRGFESIKTYNGRIWRGIGIR